MIKFLVTSLFFLAIQCNASLDIYGVGNLGFMVREGEEKFASFEKYGGGFGLQYRLLSFLSFGGEIQYTRGVSTDPIPYKLKDKKSPATYGGFSNRGVDFVNVHYFELWLRPKLILPIPFVEPYLVIPVSPISIGGMQGYSKFGAGFGGLLGIQASIKSLSLFVESGLLVRSRKGADNIDQGPPWGMFDFSVPVNLGVGYAFF